MGYRRSGLAAAAAAVLALTGLPAVGHASDPASATISPEAPETAWAGESYPLAAVPSPDLRGSLGL